MVFASILIPTYRRSQLLSRALAASIEQGAQISEPIEIVVVDNCANGSAKSVVTDLSRTAPISVRYVHEPRRGIATVRNSALHAAAGRYVIFLDDDQLPQPGWLRALIDAARKGAKAGFGPLAPQFEEAPAIFADALKRMFSRELHAENGDEIGHLYPYLGTGNSLFEKQYCFPHDDPFDVRLNFIGGEDVWMLSGLHARNVPLTWVAEAYALEFVSTSRMTYEYLRDRRFSSGQNRARLSLHLAKRRYATAFFWMSAGAAQMAINLTLCWLTWFFDRERALDYRIKASAGMGKFFWLWRSPFLSEPTGCNHTNLEMGRPERLW